MLTKHLIKTWVTISLLFIYVLARIEHLGRLSVGLGSSPCIEPTLLTQDTVCMSTSDSERSTLSQVVDHWTPQGLRRSRGSSQIFRSGWRGSSRRVPWRPLFSLCHSLCIWGLDTKVWWFSEGNTRGAAGQWHTLVQEWLLPTLRNGW